MRGLKSTLFLIVVLAGLGAYIYFVDSKTPASTVGPGGIASETKDKAFTVEADKIEEVRVTADKQTSVLKKVNGTWQLVEPVKSDADQTEASALANTLAGLEVNRVVEENAADLSGYGLADPRFKVAFKAADGAGGELYIGEKTATQNDLYAVKAGEKRVFLVPAFNETSLNKKPFDLRDKRILTVKRDDIDAVDITGAADVQLARTGTEWNVKRPMQARGDYSAIEGLITRITTANMTKMVEQPEGGGSATPEVLAKYGLDKPAITVTVGAGSAKAAVAFGKEEEGAVYARDLSRPMVFAVDPSLVTDLKKAADEYRNKNLFEFRPFNLARLRIVRGSDTYEFQKIGASGANQADKWQRTINGGAAADVDTAKMDDLLSKLSNLRFESFGATARPQLELVVSTSHDEGNFERVRIGKAGSDVVATRDGEAVAGRVDATNYGETIKALDAVVK
jgi:Domain of unknown function (DUF4340)